MQFTKCDENALNRVIEQGLFTKCDENALNRVIERVEEIYMPKPDCIPGVQPLVDERPLDSSGSAMLAPLVSFKRC